MFAGLSIAQCGRGRIGDLQAAWRGLRIPPHMIDGMPDLPLAAEINSTTSRRNFLRTAAGSVAAVTALGATAVAQQKPGMQNDVQLSQIDAATEAPMHTPGPFLAPGKRIGFAIVGLGRLLLDQILPAFASSQYCKPVALVSGDAAKAHRIAAQYGIPESNVTDYPGYEKLKDMPGVDVIYIVLPNSMHREFVVRGAAIGKHILCEKPMANSVADCEAMIAACKRAHVKLMIAYRQQYEPMNRTLGDAVKSGKLGKLRSMISTNSQSEGDPAQWRLNHALAGGGCLPDVGIYCLNAARFLSGEEPEEVFGATLQSKDDPRFKEVESHCSFVLKFPSGFVATCTTAYDVHRSQFLRLEGTDAWGEMSPAFGYHGSKLRFARLNPEKHDETIEPSVPDKDQFALEMDHFADCVMTGKTPRTPGEEGLQDQRIVEAIYKSAATGRAVRVAPPAGPTRGPELPPMQG